jgi:glucokinase
MAKAIISVDLGGTQIRSARLDEHLNIIERYETLTLADEGYVPTMERIKQAIRRVLPAEGDGVSGIGISAPGPLDPSTGVIVAPPNLKGWHNVPLGDILQKEFGVPVYCGNDANVAALAEVARGSARGYKHAIYITISTGIGSGIVYDGRLLLGKHGLAGEAGHIPLVVDGGRVSSLEKEAAGPSLARRARAQIEGGRASLIRELVNGDLPAITARTISDALAQGDALAREMVEYCGFCVGLGIVSLLHLFNPEVVVIGGGVSNIGAPLFKRIEAVVREYALDEAYWRELVIAPAKLKGDVSIVGAGALVLTQGGQSNVTSVVAAMND